MRNTRSGRLVVKNVTQAAIFEHELKGQISDGAWENTPNTSWEMWCDAKVEVGEAIGRDFHPRKANFDFARSDLVSIIGDRMISYARLAKKFGYDGDIDIHRIQSIMCGFRDMDFTMKKLANIKDYKGEWWDKCRAEVAKAGLENIKEALEDDSYGEKELLADLREIKKACKSVLLTT